jgi:hypothetical protein
MWATMGATALIGFSLACSRSGLQTFSIERQPTEASSVTAALYCLQYGTCFLVVSVAPPIIERISAAWTFTALGGMILGWCVPLLVTGVKYANVK